MPRKKKKRRAVQRKAKTSVKRTVPQNTQMPLIQLPLFEHFNKSQYWYGLLPEMIVIQGSWIEGHVAKLNIDKDLKPYLMNAISLHQTALIVAGNDRAYFSLYSLRAILERIALAWTLHSTSSISAKDVLKTLKSDNMKSRKTATQTFVDQAGKLDPDFTILYNMISQYFAHASKMDGVVLDGAGDKDVLLKVRAKVLPLFLLLDAGQRIVLLIEALLREQGVTFESPSAGRKPHLSISMDKYVRLCTYIACEKHTPKHGVPIATLLSNMKDVEGKIGLNNIYRGGMELVRFGDPSKRPEVKEIASFAWYAIGRDHDDKVKVKCVKQEKQGEVYQLSWPKSLEIDSAGIGMMASHGTGPDFPYFDYIDQFLKVIESHEAGK